MFWARTKALSPLLNLCLVYDDFPPEQGQTDQTIMHTIERLFLYACEQAGYDWMKVAVPSHYEDTSTILAITSRKALRRFMAEKCVRLLRAPRG